MAKKFTPTERRLFDFFKQRQGEIISHRRLIAILLDLWRPPLVVRKRDKGLLRQYISRLRKKIEKDPALPDIIITHRGQGYSYEEDFEEFIMRETEAAIEGGIIDDETGLPFDLEGEPCKS